MSIKKIIIGAIIGVASIGTTLTLAYAVDWRATPEITEPVANQITYNGREQELVQPATTTGGTIQYALGTENEATTEYQEDIPKAVKAGEYYVWYKVIGDEKKFHDVEPNNIEVIINKAKVDEPTISTNSFIYDGTEKEVTLNGVESYMTKSNDSIVKATSKGTYTITYILDSNHEWATGSDGVISWSISKAQATITVDTTPIVKTYGDSIIIPEATTNVGTVTRDKVASDLVNAGSYTITYKIEETDDYLGDTKTISVIINKKEIIVPNLSGSYTYNGSEQSVTINNFDSNTMEYANDSVSKSTAAGSYKVKVSLKDSNNYKWATSFNGELDWIIAKAKVDEPTITTNSFVYDGTEKEVTQNGVETYMTKSNDSIVKATSKGTYTITYNLDSNHEWNTGSDGIITWDITKAQATITVDTTPIVKTYGEDVTIPEATTNLGTVTCDKVASDLVNAGSYTITYKIEETDNYTGDTKTVSVTINKKEITVPNLSGSYTYNGSEQSVTINNFDSNTMEYANDSVSKSTAAGSYKVKVSLKDSNNYKWATSFNGELDWAIAKAKVDEPTIITNSFVYDGTEKEVTQNGVETYMTKSNDSIVKATSKGTYTITYILDSNHEWATGSDGVISWSISKAQATITVDTTPIVKTYGEDVTIPEATTNLGTVTCDKVASDLVNAGSYTITYTVVGTDNYTGDTKTVSVTINKATPIYTAPTAATNLVYNGVHQSSVSVVGQVNDSDSYHWEYKLLIYDNDYYKDVRYLLNAGTYTIYYKLVVTNSNYSDPNIEQSFDVSVAKVTPTVTAPTPYQLDNPGQGNHKYLCSNGYTNFGTLWYSFDAMPNNTYLTPPQAYTPGTYTVYYWVVGDGNVNDVSKQSITCVIKD